MDDDLEGELARSKSGGLKDPKNWFKNEILCDEHRRPIGYRLVNGAEYKGELKKFAAHGNGLLENGVYSFAGMFQRGSIFGQGTMCIAGHRLEGEFENGFFVEGSHRLPNGTVYSGKPASDGQWSGPSIHIEYSDGRKYDGEVSKGCPHGRGRMTSLAVPGCPSSIYEGEFSHGVRHGRGALTLPNGDVVDGAFADGILIGQGTMRSADGCGILEASTWISNAPDGKGSLRFPGGARYIGEFRAGEMNGHGRLEHPAETASGPAALIYEGGFADGRAHGAGSLTIGGDGVGGGRVEARWTGDWKDGLPDGRGLLEEPHGKRGELRALAAVDFSAGSRDGVFSRPEPAAAGAAPAQEDDTVVSRAQRA
jgi:hypothetical protein